ncbi:MULTISPECIES: hypothetical protein [Sphingobium]|jgi:hypothetical protein|uniref:hypothetical protein n=1 Tax=Sphingobium TaxID=165695 RepID=UPI000DBB5885|nr:MULTISPECIES: hypothetical protein [Sphingobium]KAA9017731.1 hypothetical protein F4U94_06540 [Sphingobium limneticum]MBU0932347.1 hypothetical protein [Alphaproteobacteria bacterium]BBD00155.1 hypothetical protein YGS_C1P1410 [Sphingobium sp. YG1]
MKFTRLTALAAAIAALTMTTAPAMARPDLDHRSSARHYDDHRSDRYRAEQRRQAAERRYDQRRRHDVRRDRDDRRGYADRRGQRGGQHCRTTYDGGRWHQVCR